MPLFFERISEPVSIIATICQQIISFRKRAQQSGRSGVIADLTRAEEEAQRLAIAIGQGMKLRVEATFRAADQALAPPFLSRRLDAVRWAFR